MIRLPPLLANLRQFCCRDGKRPITRDPETGNLVTGWTRADTWMSLDEAQAMVDAGRTYRHEKEKNKGEWIESKVNGIGFLNSKSEDPKKQLVGGDLDACRDPVTGELSAWSKQFLEDTQPFYVEISPSLCGIRMFYLGHLPNRADKFDAHGPDDIPPEMKMRMMAAKPKIKELVENNNCPWNGLELYEAGRHLTITGIDSRTYEAVDRSSDIMIALLPMISEQASKQAAMPPASWLDDMTKDAAGKRLPELKILDVALKAGFVEFDRPGGQIRGSIPSYPSTTGCNIVLDPGKNVYSNMHNGLRTGGDPWVWICHANGSVPWEVPGNDLLKNPDIRKKALEYALSKNLVKSEDVPQIYLQAKKFQLSDVAISDGEGPKERWKFSPTKATQSVLDRMKLAMCKQSEKIYYFNGQIYVPDGERIINNALCDAGGDLSTIKNKKETTSRLRDLLLNNPVTFDFDPYLLGVKNGVVDLRTGEFRGYKSEDLITDQIDVMFDKEVTCPNFIKFIKEVAPNEIDQAMLIDWFAIHAIKLMFPYVMFLNGLGRNGKGVYERILKKFYGEESFSNMPLEELDIKNNRFAGIGLYRKRGQIVSEAGEENRKGKRSISTNYLKNATGDGIIDTDQKNMGRIQFKPYYKATIDSNDIPLIDDISKGWMERFCKADLPYQYVDNPDPDHHPMERKKDPKLFEKLTTDVELSGILNLIIERTIVISKTMTITRRSGEEMFAEYRQQSNSVITFLDKFCDYQEMGDSKNNIFFDIIYKAYENWCNILVCDKVDERRFGASVKKLCGGRDPERVHVLSDDGRNLKKRVYRGLTFDANHYQALLDHQRTIKGPLKTVAGPLGPLNTGNIEYRGKEENEIIDQENAEKWVNGPVIDSQKQAGPDIGPMVQESKITGQIAIISNAGIPEKTDPHQATTTRVLQVLDSYSSRGSTGNEGICVYNKSRDSTPAIHAEMAADIEQENEEIPAEATDRVEVTFTTAYQTDMDGKMVEFREGDKTMVEKHRAETWQKRGIVRIEQQQQRQGAQ